MKMFQLSNPSHSDILEAPKLEETRRILITLSLFIPLFITCKQYWNNASSSKGILYYINKKNNIRLFKNDQIRRFGLVLI